MKQEKSMAEQLIGSCEEECDERKHHTEACIKR